MIEFVIGLKHPESDEIKDLLEVFSEIDKIKGEERGKSFLENLN